MDMLPSLCAAMVRANGDSLVLESGRAPYVVAGTHRQDVAKATLSDNALEALVGQIFSESARHTFKESGFASEDGGRALGRADAGGDRPAVGRRHLD